MEVAEMAEGLLSSPHEAAPTQSPTAKLSSAPLPTVAVAGRSGYFAIG